MPAVHRLSADIFEDDFDLMALHSRLEDYALAYALNLCLKTGFVRRRKDLDVQGQIKIPVFEWKDEISDRYWTFFTNRGTMEKPSVRGAFLQDGLFKDEPSFGAFHLVPEYRNADYFLKIEQDGQGADREADNLRLIKSLQNIPRIEMAYIITTNDLKSKNNLIF